MIKGRPEPAFLVYLVGGVVGFVFVIWVRALPQVRKTDDRRAYARGQ